MQVCRAWLPWILGLLLPGTLLAEPQGHWRISGDTACLLQSCAQFTTAGDPPRVVQQGVWDVDLPSDGLLTVPARGVALEWHQAGRSSRFPLRGPAILQLTRQGWLRPIGPLELKKAGHATGFDVGVGPLVISAEGTRFVLYATASGGVCLRVKRGRVRVTSRPSPNAPALKLLPGQGIYLPPDTLPEKLPPVLEGRPLLQQCQTIQTAMRSRLERGAATPEAQLTSFLAEIADLQGRALAERVRFFVDEEAASHTVAARAVYLAWLKARATRDLEADQTLGSLLQQSFPDSPWRTLLLVETSDGIPEGIPEGAAVP